MASFYTWRDAERQVVTIRATDGFTSTQVDDWERDLIGACQQVPPETTFRTLVDIRGYEVGEQNPGVPKIQRVVDPVFLAKHGFEVGYFRLLHVVNTISVDPARPLCTAIAHVYHD